MENNIQPKIIRFLVLTALVFSVVAFGLTVYVEFFSGASETLQANLQEIQH